MLKTKRIYEEYKKDDGFRVLVDRLWPRGISKEKAHINLWLKDLAPSGDLRKSFNHDRGKWETFKKAYFRELDSKEAEISKLMSKLKIGSVTLVYAAKYTKLNNAVALKEYLDSKNFYID